MFDFRTDVLETVQDYFSFLAIFPPSSIPEHDFSMLVSRFLANLADASTSIPQRVASDDLEVLSVVLGGPSTIARSQTYYAKNNRSLGVNEGGGWEFSYREITAR